MESIYNTLSKLCKEQYVLTLNQACVLCGVDSGKIIKYIETDEEMARKLFACCYKITKNLYVFLDDIEEYPNKYDVNKVDQFQEEVEKFFEQKRYILQCMRKHMEIQGSS
jgi:hypothetical protein